MINALSFDIEDWFQVENLKSKIAKDSWDKLDLRVIENTRKILEILSFHKVKATFFVLGWIAKKCPELVKEIDRQGHEVASHGYSHELIYRQSKQEFKEDIQLSKKLLEDIIHKEVIGYRAPSFSITKDSVWALDILEECGFKYDSSIFPTSFHDRYGFKEAGNTAQPIGDKLIEFPISTYRLFHIRLPLGGGGYFRLFPYVYFRSLFKLLNKRGERFVFYLHPWELDDGQPRLDIPLSYRIRHYINLKNTEAKLRRLLQDFDFQPIREIINDIQN